MSLRIDLIHALARGIDEESFQPSYHKKPHGRPVTGWGERLSSYFWPNPEVDYAYTFQLMDPWFSEAGTLSQRLIDNSCWTQAERTQAKDLAWQMLKWGGVTRQKLFSEATVEAVFRRALGLQTARPVPMNSGWTKVAALLATAYLEGGSGQQPHAIWDSRVSTSLVTRLNGCWSARGIAILSWYSPRSAQY